MRWESGVGERAVEVGGLGYRWTLATGYSFLKGNSSVLLV